MRDSSPTPPAPVIALSGSTFSFSPSASLGVNSQRLTGLAAPTSGSDAATKTYVYVSVLYAFDFVRLALPTRARSNAFQDTGITMSGLSCPVRTATTR